MFHKDGSSTLQVAGKGGGGGGEPSSNNAGNNRGGNKKKNNNVNTPSTTKAMDVTLGKKERKQLRQRAMNFFEKSSTLSDDDKMLTNLLDHIFLQHDGNIMIRTLQPYPNNKAWTMNLYLIAPSPSSPSSTRAKNNNSEVGCCWPYQQQPPQFLWMALQEKKKVVCETPTVAFWSVILHHLCCCEDDGSNNNEQEQEQRKNDILKSILDNHTIMVPSAVSKFVCRGADLMRAGVITTNKTTNITAGSSSKKQIFDKEEEIMVAIRIPNNPQPFAVGLLKKPSEPFGGGTKGVAVEIWNCYGDDLWRTTTTTTSSSNNNSIGGIINRIGGASFDNGQYGNVGFIEGKYVAPIVTVGSGGEDEDEEEGEENQDGDAVNPQTKTAWDEPGDDNYKDVSVSAAVVSGDEEDNNNYQDTAITAEQTTPDDVGNPALAATTAGTDDAQVNEEEKPQQQSSPSPEDILHQAVCQGLVSLSNKDLPMPVTTFYSQYVIPNRPEGTTIDLKATKYKKFSNYIKEQISNGLLQAGPDKSNPKNTDPLALLLGFRKKHDDLQGFSKANAVASSATSSTSSTKLKLVLVTLYIIPSHWPELLRLDKDDVDACNASSEERKGTGMLTATEVRTILEKYLEREELIPSHRPDLVNLDGPLTKLLYKKESNPPTQLARKDIQKMFLSKLSPAYALVEMPGSKITTLKRGSPPKIEIEVSMRQSKKFVTRIRGLEDYNIDPTYFGKDVAKRLACSVTVEDDPVGRAALKKGRVELVFQGNVVDELEALLTGDESLSSHGGVKRDSSDYIAIPQNVLDITLRKGVPARKRGGGGGGKKRK